jgi:hypothetical protein
MNRLLLLPLLLSSVFAFAHEGGHEPRFEEVTRERGVVAPVVLASEAALGPKAAEVYTAKLVRAGDGGVKVLLYAADLGRLSERAKGVVLTVSEGKTKKIPFGLTLDRGISAYVGRAQLPASKPYTIEVSFSEGKRKLSSAFINLD